MSNYTAVEYISSLWRAFIDGRCAYVSVASRRDRFLGEAAEWGASKGILTKHVIEYDEQSTEWQYRLTDFGRQVLRMLPADKMRDPYFKNLTPEMIQVFQTHHLLPSPSTK